MQARLSRVRNWPRGQQQAARRPPATAGPSAPAHRSAQGRARPGRRVAWPCQHRW